MSELAVSGFPRRQIKLSLFPPQTVRSYILSLAYLKLVEIRNGKGHWIAARTIFECLMFTVTLSTQSRAAYSMFAR